MGVLLEVATEAGWVEFARFWDMESCTFVLDMLALLGGIGACVVGVAV